MMLRRLALALLLAGTTLLGGCGGIRYLAYLFAPTGRSRTVPAAFKDLQDSRVAVVVFTDMDTEFEYPYARPRLTERVTAELSEHIKGIETVEPRQILNYQRDHVYWDAEDRTTLGKRFGADYVVFIAVREYSLREPGSTTLYRGRITGEVSVHKTSLPAGAARVWPAERGPQTVTVSYPKDAAMGTPDAQLPRIRNETESLFVDKLAKHFYKHKEQTEP
ncbi:MAG: hypothetical protein ACOC8F_00425 [Planctomycetota bacterium]